MTPEPLVDWQGRTVRSWADAWQVPCFEAYDTLDSTNDRARELAEAGAGPFTVVVADAQRAGRGRGGKSWHSPAGCGLWLSFLLPGRPAGSPPPISLLVGLAAAEAIEARLPGSVITLEWPNDLTLEGRKIGGILCEAWAAGWVAGIGINLRSPTTGYPPSYAGRATSLEAVTGKTLSPSALAGSVMDRVKRRIVGVGDASRLASLNEIRARDALAGRTVETDQHGRGVAVGIAPDGALVLERPDGTRVPVVAGGVRPIAD